MNEFPQNVSSVYRNYIVLLAESSRFTYTDEIEIFYYINKTIRKVIIYMWIANDWKEYEVIDTSCGEKLERWGKYTLVRPDPQVIWDTPKVSRGWKNMNAHYHRSKKRRWRMGIF